MLKPTNSGAGAGAGAGAGGVTSERNSESVVCFMGESGREPRPGEP